MLPAYFCISCAYRIGVRIRSGACMIAGAYRVARRGDAPYGFLRIAYPQGTVLTDP